MIRAVVAVALALTGTGCKTRREEWIGMVEPALVGAMCKADAYFPQCYTVDTAACRAGFAPVVRRCIEDNKSRIPEDITQESGREGGRIIGECAGTAYESELVAAGKRRSDPRCDDPSNWTPGR